MCEARAMGLGNGLGLRLEVRVMLGQVRLGWVRLG